MLKIYKDKVVIEGHEQTKEQCETMTLLANALKDSKDFKVVDYKNGYAEFEKVGKSNELKFVAGLFNITINFDSNVVSIVDNKGSTFTKSGDTNVTYSFGVTYTFNVTLKEGYELDSVTSSDEENLKIQNVLSNSFTALVTDFEGSTYATITITTKAIVSKKSVDLTTLTGWNELSDGTHNITIVAKGTGYSDSDESDSVQVNKSSGETWVLNSAVNRSALSNLNFTVAFSSNGNNYNKILGDYFEEKISYDTTSAYNSGTWFNQAYRTITFDTAPTGDLLTWLQANGTKQ